MSLNEEVDLLRNIPLFAHVDPPRLKFLAFASDRIRFQAGQELFHSGDAGDAAFIIIEGEASIFIEADGSELEIAKAERNDIVGEIAILCDVPRTATVRATSDLEALRISKELFFQTLKEFPQMSIQVMRELAQRLELTNAKLREAIAAKSGT